MRLLSRRLPFVAIAVSLLSCNSGPIPGPSTRGSGAAIVERTDALGRKVRLPLQPGRIVSLAPSITEILYLLGAQDRLIGVTTHCDWPEEVRTKPKIGTLLSPNYEVILAAQPDLVIATTAGNDRTAVLKLAELGLPLFVTAPRSVEKIYDTVIDVARITDRARAGEQLVAEMKSRLEEVRRRLEGLPPTRAFYITWFEPLLAPGRDTFENDALRYAGVESITAGLEEFYPRYSLEQVLARDPDVILTVGMGGPQVNLAEVPGWKGLKAVREGKVYVLSEEFQHPSPRFVDGVEELARMLHPERFR